MAKKAKKTGRKATAKKAAVASRKNGKLGGRPRRDLDVGERAFFEAMCAAGALEQDIAEALRIDRKTVDTICKRDYDLGFSAFRYQKLGMGRARLAAKQLQVALDGNPTMLIWLGKQWLAQTDTRVHTGTDGGPIKAEVTIEERRSAVVSLVTDPEIRAALALVREKRIANHDPTDP